MSRMSRPTRKRNVISDIAKSAGQAEKVRTGSK